MSTKTQEVLRRRLAAVRWGFQDAYLVFSWSRWKALSRREQMLSDLCAQHGKEAA